jgi:hypothetical protein
MFSFLNRILLPDMLTSGGGISLFQFSAVPFHSFFSFQAARFLFFNFPLSFFSRFPLFRRRDFSFSISRCPFSLFFLFSGGGISLFQFPAVLFRSVFSFQAAGFLFFNFPLSFFARFSLFRRRDSCFLISRCPFSLGFLFSGGGILVF